MPLHGPCYVRSVTYALELSTARRLAHAAGELAVELRAGGLQVDFKDGDEPVTRADREASAAIVSGLAQVFPQDVIISEELELDARRLVAPRVWYVDPIDGTRDFARGDDGFSVMIGLCVEGVPTVGVVYQPTRRRTYAAAPGLAAEVSDADGVRPLQVSAVADPSQIRLAASASHRTADIDRVKDRLGIVDELNVGSVGLKLCLIAAGARDLYVNPAAKTKAWDTCAPQVILHAAGGQLTDLYGAAIDYRAADIAHRCGLVASNGVLHERVLEQLGALFPRAAS